MDFSVVNDKLENALDIIMDHFAETQDRITELEDEIERLRNELKEIGEQR